jgi:hypothetical protein
MATPDKIATLTRIRVPLKTGEFDEREFHAMPSLLRFLEEILPGAKAGVLGATESPAAQMDTLLRKWNVGKPLVYSRAFSNLKPTVRGVWEMKTVDLRIFGWLWRPKIFIATFAGLADDYKSQDGKPPKESYGEARDRVVWIRDRLDLDPPTFVTGEYNALI